MKIALINPKSSFLSLNPEISRFWNTSVFTSAYRQNWSGIGTGLLIIAGLTPPEFDVEIIDENIELIDYSRNYDLVGITAMTQQAFRAYEIADEFRKREVTVVIGGIHATVLPEEASKHASCVVVGEAEYLWPLLIHDFKNKTLKEKYVNQRTVNLLDVPLPRYDLLRTKGYKTMWIQASRGCPHECEFCAASNVYGKKVRYKRVGQVIKEIRMIKRIFGNIKINFGDDNLLVNKKYAMQLLQKLIPLKIRWATQTDISIAEDIQLLKLLRKSGCHLVFIGFESLSEESIKSISKYKWDKIKTGLYAKYINKIQSFGISVMGAFIVGFDRDDKNIFERIAQFAVDNNLGDIQVSILTPLPGTQIRKKLEEKGRIISSNWERYTVLDVNIKHEKMTKEDIEQGVLYIYKKINNKEQYLKKMNYFKEVYKKLLYGIS